MAQTDFLADVLTKIRNASAAGKEKVEVPASHLVGSVLEIFKGEGFIRDFKSLQEGPHKHLLIYLKFGERRRPVIEGLRRVSKPGLRVYAKVERLPKVLGGLGCAVISTSKGVMTDRQCRETGVGGEVLCYIW